MKNVLRQEKGVTLISLAVVIVIMGIITTMLLYNIKDTKDVTNLTDLYSDIDNLSDKISNYYAVYGTIPAKSLTGLDTIISTNWDNNDDDPRGANDSGTFLVIDLSAIEGISLNFGRDYDNIKNSNTIQDSQTDLYIINEASHNIFYLKGLVVEGHTYYTNQDKDTEKVNLRYIDGVKIYDGYNYVSGNKSNGIIITNGNENYKWIDLGSGEYTLTYDNNNSAYITNRSGVQTNIELVYPQTYPLFVNSSRIYKGFYLKQQDSANVLYFAVPDESLDSSWTLTYNVESIYKDENGDIAYIPAGFQVSKLLNKNTISSGLVIRNATTMQKYVWIDVPDKVLKGVNGFTNIGNELRNYVSSYRSSNYTDTWYDGCGINNSAQYEEMKNTVYDNIKKKGGFWMSVDEVGNNTTLTDARSTANAINNGSGVNTDLLFGIQWDLACKFVNDNANGDATKLNILNFDSSNYEWTLEFAETGDRQNASALNSVARAGSGGIAAHTAYNYQNSNSTLAYRVMIY